MGTTTRQQGADRISGWQGSLRLRFRADSRGATLCERAHRGPLLVQRPFYPEGPDIAHVYLLHPPGGFVSGDAQRLDVTVEENAAALLTAPGAARYYRSDGRSARFRQTLRVRGALEHLPNETILYRGARGTQQTRVHLADGAGFVGWEIFCAGRPASGEVFDAGTFSSEFLLTLGGHLLLRERVVLEGDAPARAGFFGWQGLPVWGSFYCMSPDARADLAALREHAGGRASAAVTLLAPRAPGAIGEKRGLLVARYLGPSVQEARCAFEALRSLLRERVMGRRDSRPRIWNT